MGSRCCCVLSASRFAFRGCGSASGVSGLAFGFSGSASWGCGVCAWVRAAARCRAFRCGRAAACAAARGARSGLRFGCGARAVGVGGFGSCCSRFAVRCFEFGRAAALPALLFAFRVSRFAFAVWGTGSLCLRVRACGCWLSRVAVRSRRCRGLGFGVSGFGFRVRGVRLVRLAFPFRFARVRAACRRSAPAVSRALSPCPPRPSLPFVLCNG